MILRSTPGLRGANQYPNKKYTYIYSTHTHTPTVEVSNAGTENLTAAQMHVCFRVQSRHRTVP